MAGDLLKVLCQVDRWVSREGEAMRVVGLQHHAGEWYVVLGDDEDQSFNLVQLGEYSGLRDAAAS